jgi:hypothetical protein
MKKYPLFLLAAGFCLLGCDGSGSAICEALSRCGAAPINCEATFDALILPDGCEEAVIAADCEEHHLDVPSYMDLCFPPCGDYSAVCTGDVITVCQDGRTKTLKCPGMCKLVDLKSTGVCADEYQGQTSDNGQDLCWCE